MQTYSYHIFYFPFRWSMKGNSRKNFSEQVDLSQIPISSCSRWERMQLDTSAPMDGDVAGGQTEACELFAERQYFYDFVHPVLYDIKGETDPLIYHFERKEPKEKVVKYVICVKGRNYVLKVDAINLNLYATGVGVLSFFLANREESQKDRNSVLTINQFGRRIMPPHAKEFSDSDRTMIASSIALEGLDGMPGVYSDAFDYKLDARGEEERGLNTVWQPARFIENLIADLSAELRVKAVIDDRMLVNCWYANQDLADAVKYNRFSRSFDNGDFWYKYVYVDTPDFETCQEEEMKDSLLKSATYGRWRNFGTLFGVSRYSFVVLTDEGEFNRDVLSMHMRTIYSRMFELVIVQRASMLRFSAEVTKVGALQGVSRREVAYRIGSVYKEYIRFINQVFFRSITSQDQGIELYEFLLKQFNAYDQIKDLDSEIDELYRYATLLVDQKRSENGDKLNFLAAIFLPATVLSGFFGMNPFEGTGHNADMLEQGALIVVVSVIVYYLIMKWRK